MKRRFRLKRSKEIMRVRRFGKTYAHPLLTLHVLKSDESSARVAISAGKIIGNAVTRNRAKRRIRSIMDDIISEIRSGQDIVLVAKRKLTDCNFRDAQRAVVNLLQKADLFEHNQIHE